MKKSLFIVIFLFLTVSLSAQEQFRKPLKSQKQGTNLAFSDYTIGMKLGCPWSIMPDSKLSNVTYSGNIGYTLGIVVERYFPRFSVGIEGLLSQKGTKIYYDWSYQQNLTTNGTYHKEFFMGYNVVSMRVPVTYYFKGIIKDDKAVPYVFIAPQVDIPLGFNATLRHREFLFEKPLTQTTITTYGSYYDEKKESVDVNSLLSANALAGLGIMARIPTESSAIVIKFDVAFNFGLRNLAEEGFIWKQVTDSNGKKKLVLKDNSRTIYSNDAEANLTLIIPIKKKLHDACHGFRK